MSLALSEIRPRLFPNGVQFTIHGQLYSMKNSKIARRGGFPVKHQKARQFEKDFALQVPPEYRNLRLQGPLRINVTVYYPSRRQDLDAALVFDCLQKSGVIANDRDLIEQHLYREVSKDKPRVEISLEEL